MFHDRRFALACAVSAFALSATGGAWAQSTAYTRPNIVSGSGASSVVLNGETFVNQGLVGTARLPATLRDFNGETLGSFSGMAIDLGTWRRTSTGGYTATLYTLPDRGPNNVGGLTTTDYAARLNQFSLTFTPDQGTAAVPQTTQQMQLTPTGGVLLRDTTGQVFSGRDPRNGTVVRDGVTYPVVPAGGPGAGKIAVDAEAVTFLPDGTFYVGDEYGAQILYFDASGRQIGAIQAAPDIIPRVNGQINFNGTNDSPLVAGTTGRRSNQGLEGLSVTPDGTRLVAVLQSATLQDNPTNSAARRNNTRVLVYDISNNKTPTAPIGEYVLQLPTYNNSLTGVGNANATAAQSEILALNDSQFLVLSRDGNGRGANSNAIAFKSVLLVDITGATNLVGTSYAAGTTPISTSANPNGSGQLVPGIVPVQQVELVNMLNTTQLNRFGINLNTAPSTQYSLSEKWEALGLAPTLEEQAPQDFFLLIGNDNDFVSSNLSATGISANTALTSPTAGTGSNDNVILIYRLTLPTYVDPMALRALNVTGPMMLAAVRQSVLTGGTAAASASTDNLAALRRASVDSPETFSQGWRFWGQTDWRQVETQAAGSDLSTDGAGASAGLDFGWRGMRLGVALAYQNLEGDFGSGFDVEASGYSAALYAGLVRGDVYGHAVFSHSIGFDLDQLARPSAYGQIGAGATDAQVWSGEIEMGWAPQMGAWRVGPFINLAYSRAKIGAYTEHNASVSNLAYGEQTAARAAGTAGVEASRQWGPITPSLRLGYTRVANNDDSTTVRLASARHRMAVVELTPVTLEEDFGLAEMSLQGEVAGFAWRAAAQGRFSGNDSDARVTFALARAF